MKLQKNYKRKYGDVIYTISKILSADNCILGRLCEKECQDGAINVKEVEEEKA